MACPRVAITAFRPFPGVATNPSALVLDSLQRNGDAAMAGLAPRYALLDTVYAELRRNLAVLLASKPAALVLTGYSRHAERVTLETRATSECVAGRPDASGWCPPESTAPIAACNNSAVDFERLAAQLAGQDLPVELSRDAGGYVCNASYWHALDLIAQRGLSTRALFVHLPRVAGMDDPPPGDGALPLRDMRRAVATIARLLARQG